MNLHNAQTNDKADALLDFNRDKDGIFSRENPVLPIPQITQDIYAYSGQGIGGSFKAYRNDMPILFDPLIKSASNHSANFGVNKGVVKTLKFGVDIGYSYTNSESGRWKIIGNLPSINDIANNDFFKNQRDIFEGLGFGRGKDMNIKKNPLLEPFYLKSIGELTADESNFLPIKSYNKNVVLNLVNSLSSSILPNNNYLNFEDIRFSLSQNGNYYRNERLPRNTYIKAIKAKDEDECFTRKIYSYPRVIGSISEGFIPDIIDRNPIEINESHTTEIQITNTDGRKYIYGVPAYNKLQEEYVFTNAKSLFSTLMPTNNCMRGTQQYLPESLETDSRYFGSIDQFYEKTKIPPYAHSYLLTSIQSADYLDIGLDGYSRNDIGNYTIINYSKVSDNYKWRVPYNEYEASYNEGLKSDKYDDKASFVYGEKEIWHVHSIIGKNHIAYFYISTRQDGLGVKDVNGGKNLADPKSYSYKLDSIVLFSLNDIKKPLQKVHFEYDYSLCKGVDNNINTTTNTGKLTLRKIYFTYGNSFKEKYNSYDFNYSNINPDYSFKGYNRWGNYKPLSQVVSADQSVITGLCNDNSGVLFAYDFPYVEQDKNLEDQYSSAWHLTEIKLPSGGLIRVNYESDDYAYVQDKYAMQMFRLLGFSDNEDGFVSNELYNKAPLGKNKNYLFFEVPDEITSETEFKRIVKNNLRDNNIYYSILLDLDSKNSYEYIKGYAKAIDFGLRIINGKSVGWVKLEEAYTNNKNLSLTANPISLAAWQYTQLNLPQLINRAANPKKSDLNSVDAILSTAKSLISSSFILKDIFVSVYSKLRTRGFASRSIPQKSWIRLNHLTGKKLGGGSRVKSIMMVDSWAEMLSSSNNSTEQQGQEFDYTIIETKGIFAGKKISSGVAAYEPLIGGDENPFRQPIFYSREKLFIPDEKYFIEEPFGESYFPAPNVGYRKVTVKNISNVQESKLSRNGTGKVVNEFFTAKDFPLIMNSNNLRVVEKNPNIILQLFFSSIDEKLRMAQSIKVEFNDMHGKPKAVWNYSQQKINSDNIEDAFSGVKYEYFEEVINGQRILKNELDLIYPDNSVKKSLIGVEAEMFVDSRLNKSSTFSGSVSIDVDAFLFGVIPVPIPSWIPKLGYTKSEFNSGVLMHVVNRHGILKSTTVYEEGATIKTENTHFDAQTGEVLVTKTQNEFNDNVYSSSIPAYYVNDNMGGKFVNDGAVFEIKQATFTNSNFCVVVNSTDIHPAEYFNIGDRLKISNSNGSLNESGYWVFKTDNGNWRLIDKDGNVLTLVSGIVYTAKVIESGKKNMLGIKTADFITLKSPVSLGSYNNIDSVINLSVIEFDDKWQIKNNFQPLSINDYCLDSDAKNLLNSFMQVQGFLNKQYIDTATSYVRGGDIIYIDSIANNFVYNSIRATFIARSINQYYREPNGKYKLKRYGQRFITSNDTAYIFGYEFEPKLIENDCIVKEIGIKMIAKFSTSSNVISSYNWNHGSNCASNIIGNNIYACCNASTNHFKKINDGDMRFYYVGNYKKLTTCFNDNPNSRYFEPEQGYCVTNRCYNNILFNANDSQLSYTSFNFNINDLVYGLDTFNKNALDFALTESATLFTIRNGQDSAKCASIGHVITITKHRVTNKCYYAQITGEKVNPFVLGLRNNYRVKREWVYLDLRRNQTTPNIRKDGTYNSFNNFYIVNNAKFQKTNNMTNWVVKNDITKYNIDGQILESKNALNNYNSKLINPYNLLPKAVANNSKYNQLYFQDFEFGFGLNNKRSLYVGNPTDHEIYKLNVNLLDTLQYHTGKSSYKITSNTRLTNGYVYRGDKNYITTSSNEYFTDTADYIGVFSPDTGKYVISAWIKVGNSIAMRDYSTAGILVTASPFIPINDTSIVTGNERYYFIAKGPIIEGWQRIEGVFNIKGNMRTYSIRLMTNAGSNVNVYFDDLRIYPFNSIMKSYVYNPLNYRLSSELDENNYATFFEYDEKGELIRIKKETEKGISTIKETKKSIHKK